MSPLSEIFPYIVSGGGIYAWIIAGKLRRAQLRKAELDVDNSWRQFYKDLVSDMKNELEEMKQEIFRLRQTVENYKASCDKCPNKKSIHESYT